MCGRFTLRTPLKQVADAFDLAPTLLADGVEWPARYNIAPTQNVAVVRQRGEEGRELSRLRWGLVPSWADDPAIGNRMINARSETLAAKPAYRDAFRLRRCLVVADGFYEWKQQARPKQPYHIRLADERPFAFAGLWDRWQRGHLVIESCTIVTTAANELLRPLHERMPVILDPADYTTWLDPQRQDPEQLEALLTAYPADRMAMRAVSTAVNSARQDSPQCLAPAAAVKTQGTLFN